MRKSREFEDTTISMLDVPTVYKIVDIMANSMSLGSSKAKEIIESYIANGRISNQDIYDILVAIKDELPNVNFKDISDNVMGIMPFYIKKLGLDISEVRKKIKSQGL